MNEMYEFIIQRLNLFKLHFTRKFGSYLNVFYSCVQDLIFYANKNWANLKIYIKCINGLIATKVTMVSLTTFSFDPHQNSSNFINKNNFVLQSLCNLKKINFLSLLFGLVNGKCFCFLLSCGLSVLCGLLLLY